MSGRVAVAIAAAGAAWEADALDHLGRGAPAVALQRRCVDLQDLLATAGTGVLDVAVVGTTLTGLDADSVAVLKRSGVAVLVVAEPDELATGAQRWTRLGVDQTLGADRLDDVLPVVTALAEPRVPDDHADTDPAAAVSDAAAGRLIVVWGPAGAPGRTTVAVGLAAELAARNQGTMLVDADPYAGAVAQHLGVLDEVSGLLAAARLANNGALDGPALAALARDVHGVRVLTGLPRADRWVEVRPAAFDDLLGTATMLAQHVVVDVGFSLEQDPDDDFAGRPSRNRMTLAALERADEVVVVGAADPVGLARLARGLLELRYVAPAVPLRVAVNRSRSSLGWGRKEITDMVHGFLTPASMHFLPDDRAAADHALMHGMSLVEAGDSPLRRSLAELAGALLGEPAEDTTRRSRRLRFRPGQAPKSR